jgi:hypothetical protein
MLEATAIQSPDSPMSQTLDNRRANLRALAELCGGPVALSKRLGYKNASYVVQMYAQDQSSKWARPVTEKRARAIEEKLGLPSDLMNESPEHFVKMAMPFVGSGATTRGAATPSLPPVKIAVAPSAPRPVGRPASAPTDAELMGNVIRMVGQVLESEGVNLPPLKFSEVAALGLSDTIEHGQPRPEYLAQIIRLLK